MADDKNKAYIYIMTNETFAGHSWVKIGYATNVELRRRQLSTTALPFPYKVYATYEIPRSEHLGDKVLHKIITNLNPNLRLAQNREFFEMTPDQAYELLHGMAIIHNREGNLVKYINGKPMVEEIEDDNKNSDFKAISEMPNIFYCKSKQSNASGKPTEDGKFIVFKGSKINDAVTDSFQEYNKKLRNNLIADGSVIDNVLTRDIIFTSSSQASCFVLGRSSNGLADWRTEDGIPLGKFK